MAKTRSSALPMTTSLEPHPYPAHEERDVVLRSGATARLRPIRPEDAPALLRFYKGLSPNSLYFRFFSLPAIDAQKHDLTIDHKGCCGYAARLP